MKFLLDTLVFELTTYVNWNSRFAKPIYRNKYDVSKFFEWCRRISSIILTNTLAVKKHNTDLFYFPANMKES